MPFYLIAVLGVLGLLVVLGFFGWMTKELLSLAYKHWSTLKSWQQWIFCTTGLLALFGMLTVVEKAVDNLNRLFH